MYSVSLGGLKQTLPSDISASSKFIRKKWKIRKGLFCDNFIWTRVRPTTAVFYYSSLINALFLPFKEKGGPI